MPTIPVLQKKKKRPTTVGIIDIGSGSVAGSIVRLSSTQQTPEIIFTYRLPLTFGEDTSFAVYVKKVLRGLEEVLGVLEQKHQAPLADVFCFLSSAWYISQTRTISYHKKAPFTFTNRIAHDLLQKDIRKFITEHLEEGEDEANLTVIEQQMMSVALNGYTLEQPFGKQAHEIGITYLVSVSPQFFINGVIRAIERVYPSAPIQFHSFGYGAYICLRDAFEEVDDFLFIDVGYELTDVSVIKDGVLRESYAFPYGMNTIITRVAETFECGYEEALSYARLYVTDRAADDVVEKMKPLFATIEKQWVDKFQKALGDVCCDVAVPPTVFVTTETSFTSWFKNVITGEAFHQQMLAEKEYNVIPLTMKTLHGYATYAADVSHDPFITLESIFAYRIKQ